MAKNVTKRSSEIQTKLDALKLDVDNIPEILNYRENLSFKVSKVYEEAKYRRYEYLDINEIKIYLTSSNRNDELTQKCKTAKSITDYLDNKTQENILEHSKFLKMLEKLDVEELKKIDKEQEELNVSIPMFVKYNQNYLWQIYYFENINKYVMFVSVEELDNSAFFYVLKEQINKKSEKQIYVPVRNIDYTGEYLKKRHLEEMESFLWLFTKQWPSIYEVFDKEGYLAIHIVGETTVYDKIRSQYKIEITNKEDSIKFYKILKALHIIQTELPNYFEFQTKINEQGGIDFYFEGRKLEYRILAKWINKEYVMCKKRIREAKKLTKTSSQRLKELEEISVELELEYITKEKQISTFLECRKSFLGKMKYYFKYSKKAKNKEEQIEVEDEFEYNEDEQNSTSSLNMDRISTKNREKKKQNKTDLHTIDELIEIYGEYAGFEKVMKNIVMDINAIKLKNKNMIKKIENASKFIDEIDSHKKSIFEFWKYSNKDEMASLPEGEEEEVAMVKTQKRLFDFEEDFEKFALGMDKVQRKVLTARELDNVHIVTTDVIDLVNKLRTKKLMPKEIEMKLRLLKRDLNKVVSGEDDEFDIFGGSLNSKAGTSKIGNKKHREIQKNKFNILDINKNANALSLKLAIEQVIEDVEKALNKIQLQQNIPTYRLMMDEQIKLDEFMVLNINQAKEIEEKISDENAVYTLYKINLKKQSNVISFTNTLFYDNQNKTLPLGQDISTNLIIDLKNLELEQVSEDEIRILSIVNTIPQIKVIKVIEYNARKKEEKRKED